MDTYSRLACRQCGSTDLEEYHYNAPPITYNQCDSNPTNTPQSYTAWQNPPMQTPINTSQSSIIPDLQTQGPMNLTQSPTSGQLTQDIIQSSLTISQYTQEAVTSDYYQGGTSEADIKYNCTLCTQAFDNLHDLRNHQRLLHTTHVCDKCGKNFEDTVSHNRHMRNAHVHQLPEVKYTSLECQIN